MNAEPILKYIRKYVDLSSQEEILLQSKLIHRKYLKNQFIVQQGDICKVESFVISGCVRTFYADNNGIEHVVMFAIENWWTGDLGSYISQTPANYNVQCLENTEVIQFSYDNLEFLYKEIPRLERFFRIIIQKAFVASEGRIVRNFSFTAKEKYLQFRKMYPEIEQRVPQYMIASYLGITKEFLSKIRSQLVFEQ
ncbi:MAG: Crp/Fnr family transcriptional regulator [Cyclobacteriaceae bacterium]|nr:Crp/Fnr family transcriptional regulator [Cyclobacteriaceae bacterium]